jgi:hypothetical protein
MTAHLEPLRLLLLTLAARISHLWVPETLRALLRAVSAALSAPYRPAELHVQQASKNHARMPDSPLLLHLLRMALKDRAQLVFENAALRQQLAVYKRSVKRPNIRDDDRIFWVTMMRLLREWKDTLVIVQPATVVKWHRKGFRHYWRRKSRGKPGRPPIPMKLIHLIRRMSMENLTWGAPRIVDELALLGTRWGRPPSRGTWSGIALPRRRRAGTRS